jgi:hypothetical protein
MVKNLKSVVIVIMILLLPALANAGLVGDTVTVSSSGNWFQKTPVPDTASAIIGPSWEFYQTYSYPGTYVLSDFNDNALTLTFGYRGFVGYGPMVVLDYSFASAAISSVSLKNWSLTPYAAYFCCGTGLDAITLTGPNSFRLQFSSLWVSTFTFDIVSVLPEAPPITPVPEPETYAMLLAGLGLMGFMAKRRKQKLNA